MKIAEKQNQRSLLRPTLQITVLSVLGIAVSFATQIVVAAKFGAASERDAYFAAMLVPSYVSAVLLGSLNLTFVPLFIQYQTAKSEEVAWRVASIFTNLTTIVLLGITLPCVIFAGRLASIIAPGFKGEQLSLTTNLLWLTLPSIIFSGLSSLLSSICYAMHRFIRPAMAPVINSLFILCSAVFLSSYWGIKSLAFGYLIGTIVQFIILVPIFSRRGRYCFSFDWNNEGVIRIVKVMLPLVLATLFYRSTTVIERMIASSLPTGSISYLGYANRIIRTLTTIATSGIAATIFPAMSRSWAQNDLAKVREYFAKGVRVIMLTTFPIAMIFLVLGVPIIQLALERGAFDHKATVAVAHVLNILLVVLIFGGLGHVTTKGFYISQRTKLRALIGAGLVIVYWCLAYVLSKYFSYSGLAMAKAAHCCIEFVVIIAVMNWIYKGFRGKDILAGFCKLALASLIAGVCAHFSFRLTLVGRHLALRTATSGILGFLIYFFLVVWIFRIEEATLLKRKLSTKIREKFVYDRNHTT